MLDENVDRIWRDHDFHRIVNGHDPRHAGRLAGVGGIAALATRSLVGEACIEDGGRVRRQRRLLFPALDLGLVIAGLAHYAWNRNTPPLALEVRIFGLVKGTRIPGR